MSIDFSRYPVALEVFEQHNKPKLPWRRPTFRVFSNTEFEAAYPLPPFGVTFFPNAYGKTKASRHYRSSSYTI